MDVSFSFFQLIFLIWCFLNEYVLYTFYVPDGLVLDMSSLRLLLYKGEKIRAEMSMVQGRKWEI